MTKYLNLIILFACLLFSGEILADTTQSKWLELNRIGQLINNLQSKLNDDRNKKTILYQELQGTRQNIHEVHHRIEKLNKKLATHQSNLEMLKKAYQHYETDLKQQQSVLAQQVYGAYQLGRHHYVDVLLSQQNPNEISHFLHYYTYLNNARIELIEKLRHQIATTQHNEQYALHYSQSLTSLLEKQQTQWHDLSYKERAHQQTLGQLSNKIEINNQRLAQLIANKEALEKIIKKLDAEKLHIIPQGKSPFADLRGKLPWPTSGRISERFGTQIDQSGLKYTGILIDASLGQQVRAVYPGKIVFADWLQGFGLLMIIDHGKGYMTLYGHNQRFNKKVGDVIQTGDSIATVGDTSNNHHPGLYFEIRRDGHATDPEVWFSRA